jgi:hypothetical protein
MTRSLVTAVLVCAIASTLACNKSNREVASGTREDRPAASSPASASSNSGPGIDINCVYERLNNPSESFSYSYTKDTSENQHIAQEADVTPQSIDGRARHLGADQSVPFHAKRSDQQSWGSALANLTAIAGMSSTLALVNHGFRNEA